MTFTLSTFASTRATKTPRSTTEKKVPFTTDFRVLLYYELLRRALCVSALKDSSLLRFASFLVNRQHQYSRSR
jgi:hypothetical protein